MAATNTTSTANLYQEIVPHLMTQADLRGMIAELQIVKNWGGKYATVRHPNGREYKISVDDIQDYRDALKMKTGAIPVGICINKHMKAAC
jgi:hypothetical protein